MPENTYKRIIIVPGSPKGLPLEPVTSVVGGIGSGDYVCCADSGYARCAAEGIRPDIVIGDFDSVPSDVVRAAGIKTEASKPEKDDTDFLLCAKHGISLGFTKFTIPTGLAGEFSHVMGTLQVLSFLTDMECEAELLTGRERLFMLDGETVRVSRSGMPVKAPEPPAPAVFCGRPGAKFSVFSYAERSTGVFISNAKYPLDDAVLTQSYPLGARNEFLNDNPVTVSLRYGRLLIVAEV